jgi:hypothetical protein
MHIHTEYSIYFKSPSEYIFSPAYIKGAFDSNIGHSVSFWCIFSVVYTYFGILFYVCMYFEQNTGPIRMSTYCVESNGIR